MAIAFVSSTGLRIATAASTWSIASPTGQVAGGLLAIGVGVPSSVVTVSTITDNAGNVYVRAAATNPHAGASVGAELWYAQNIVATSTRISVTMSASSSGTLAAGHWSGTSTTGALLAANSSFSAASSGTKNAVLATPSQNNVLVMMYAHYGAAAAVSTGTGFDIWCSTAAGPTRGFGEYQIQGTATATDAPWRLDASAAEAEAMAFFAPAAAGGAAGSVNPFAFTLMGVQ